MSQQRATKVAALAAAGLSQVEIAKQLNISRSTVKRDLAELKPSVDEARDLIAQYNKTFDDLYPIEESAADYVDQARNDKNGAVRLAARQRIDDIRGVRTLKDLDRAKSAGDQQHQPLFQLPVGAVVNVTVNQTTTSSGLHNSSDLVNRAIDVTPSRSTGDS